MSPDRQALLSLYHDDATALLDRVLQAQHEPEGLHVVHAALVEALADAHTDGREPGVSTTVPDETLQAIEARLNAVQAETTQAQAARALRDFLNNAPTDIETLIAEVRRLTDANQRLQNSERTAATLREHHTRRLGIADPETTWGDIIEAARLDGARAMQADSAGILDAEARRMQDAADALLDEDGDVTDIEKNHRLNSNAIMCRMAAGKIRALDPAAVVGSGS